MSQQSCSVNCNYCSGRGSAIQCIDCHQKHTCSVLSLCSSCIKFRYNNMLNPNQENRVCKLCRSCSGKKFCDSCIGRKYQLYRSTGQINARISIKEPEIMSIRDIVSRNLRF